MRLFVGLTLAGLLGACPPPGGTTDSSASGDTDAATSTSATGTASSGDAPTTGGMVVECVGGGLGPAFAWATPPEPGMASCQRISDASLALDCAGDFTGIFTLTLVNTGVVGLVVGEAVEVDYRVTTGADAKVTGEWLRVRGQGQWYIVAGQGPTLAPPDAPADWFHANVEVGLVAGDCSPLACSDGSGDQFTPRAISFGQGDLVNILAAGKDGGVPGEFGGESYHAAVSEARSGACDGGEAGEAIDVLAFSVVSSGFL